VRRKLTDTSHPDETLTDQYWLRFSDNPQPPMHEKIIYLTIEHVRAKGPWDFNAAAICQRLGITNPMVNHYFGNRDGLLAAALFEVYRRYIGHLAQAIDRAPRQPRARLEAWIREQIHQTCEMGGWASMLNNPMSALNVSEVFEEDYHEQVQALFESNLVRLGYLVRDIQSGKVTIPPETVRSDERAGLLRDVELGGQVASVAWSTLGSAMWLSGQHLPSARIAELWLLKDELIDAHVDRIIRSVQLNNV
jgi:AcrR family transcriptional regulator